MLPGGTDGNSLKMFGTGKSRAIVIQWTMFLSTYVTTQDSKSIQYLMFSTKKKIVFFFTQEISCKKKIYLLTKIRWYVENKVKIKSLNPFNMYKKKVGLSKLHQIQFDFDRNFDLLFSTMAPKTSNTWSQTQMIDNWIYCMTGLKEIPEPNRFSKYIWKTWKILKKMIEVTPCYGIIKIYNKGWKWIITYVKFYSTVFCWGNHK